jgi:hypothetical protein
MARNRTIRHTIWKDTKFGTLTQSSRLAYLALHNFSDDKGYLVNDPLCLKLQCLPFDEINMDSILTELTQADLIRINNGIIKLTDFEKNQRVNRPTPSYLYMDYQGLPLPVTSDEPIKTSPKSSPCDSVLTHDDGAKPVENTAKPCDSVSLATNDYINIDNNDFSILNPCSMTTHGGLTESPPPLYNSNNIVLEYKKDNIIQSKKEFQIEQSEPATELGVMQDDTGVAIPDGDCNGFENQSTSVLFDTANRFDFLWQNYPKKIGKKRAFRNFEKTVKNESDFALICKCLGNYLATIERDQIPHKFMIHGGNWFSRWDDFDEIDKKISKKLDKKDSMKARVKHRLLPHLSDKIVDNLLIESGEIASSEIDTETADKDHDERVLSMLDIVMDTYAELGKTYENHEPMVESLVTKLSKSKFKVDRVKSLLDKHVSQSHYPPTMYSIISLAKEDNKNNGIMYKKPTTRPEERLSQDKFRAFIQKSKQTLANAGAISAT